MLRVARDISFLLLFVSVGGALLQGAAKALERSGLAPPGDLITVGGAWLNVICFGP